MLKNKKILLSSPLHIGDFCVISPCCEYLKKNYSCSITVNILRKTLPLASLCRSVDHFLIFEEWIKLPPKTFLMQLQEERYDLFLDLIPVITDDTSLQIKDILPLFAKEANIPIRIGNKKSSGFYTHATNNTYKKNTSNHIASYFLKQLKLIGIDDKLSFSELCALQNFNPPPPSPMVEKYIVKDKINLIIHPASLTLIHWPYEYNLQLLDLLNDNSFNILITGTKKEKDLFPIEIDQSYITDLRGKLSFSQFIFLISKSDCLLSVSTGPSHLAAIMRSTPITLFLNDKINNKKSWGPLALNRITIGAPNLCKTCESFGTYSYLSCCKCMSTISPKHVYKKIKSWERKIVKK